MDIRHGHLLFALKLANNLLVLALQECVATEMVNGSMLGGGHQPSAGVIWDARLGPLLEGCNERILRELFGEADIADDSCEPGNDSGRFDPPDRFDCAMCIGSRHDYR